MLIRLASVGAFCRRDPPATPNPSTWLDVPFYQRYIGSVDETRSAEATIHMWQDYATNQRTPYAETQPAIKADLLNANNSSGWPSIDYFTSGAVAQVAGNRTGRSISSQEYCSSPPGTSHSPLDAVIADQHYHVVTERQPVITQIESGWYVIVNGIPWQSRENGVAQDVNVWIHDPYAQGEQFCHHRELA